MNASADFLKADVSSPHEGEEMANAHAHLSSSFKIWVVGFIFFLTFFHLFSLVVFPKANVISDKLMLTITLGLIAYLWSQEARDRKQLQEMNQDLLQAQNKLQTAEVNTISALIRMEEAKDPYVRGHSHRVAQFSLAMAQARNFSSEGQEVIKRAALLHDLGKLVISDDIIKKPDKLTVEEWDIVKKHPQSAVDILESLKFLYLEKNIILHHHERIDGAGYPSGLVGEQIPLESKILAIADTFDAMNSARLYREPCTQEFILEELKKVAGTQLDSQLVSLFLGLLERNPHLWDREASV